MALWVIIDGEERIPVQNREEVEIDQEVETLTVVEDPIAGRDALAERRYRGYDVTIIIPLLREGDVVRVSTYPTSYPDYVLTITRHATDDVRGESENGNEFNLIARFWGSRNQGDGQPWLRTGGESRGEISEIEVVEKHDG